MRVSYHRRHYAPSYVYLPSPYVVVHGPGVRARRAYYPVGAPVYAPGYCPADVHYHPYYPEKGVHGDIHVRIRF